MSVRVAALVGLVLTAPAARADDFFESKVRPVLAEHCLKCHGDKKQQGGIRLDSAAGLKAADDGSGPVVVPGKPDDSRLIKAVRHTGEYAMPPGGKKLPEAAVRDLTQWVADGAKWPEPATAPTPGADHWAFKPVVAPPEPAVKAADWPAGPVDRFILAKLEAKGLKPSPPADRRTLLRRLTFDLTGLPPTPAEVEAFVKDDSADATAKVVDRLLASPAFGERWGRHWLDIARYADTKGAIFGEDGRYPFAYTYRDWVVKAFNADLPYDQFLVKQVAADQLNRSESHPDLAALGFLTLGRKFENNDPDIIDDRLDALFRGTQGLTVGCARCHDHKYDPVPIKDYYSLYGVFAGAAEREVPVIRGIDDRARYVAYAAELRARIRSAAKFEEVERRRVYGNHPAMADRYLLAAQSGAAAPADGGDREDGLNAVMVSRYKTHLENTKADHDPVMAPWHAFAGIGPEEFGTRAKDLARGFAANDTDDKPLNPLVARLFAAKPPADLGDVARRYGRLFADVARKWERKVAAADKADVDRPEVLEDEAEDELRELLTGPDAPLGDGVDQPTFREMLPEEKGKTFADLLAAVSAWKIGPDAPPHARVLTDPADPEPSRVFVRGKPDQPGDEVPRQFLAVLAGPDRKPFEDGSGRLDLARAIARKENPLTARVWSNRVWGHLVGRPLVETASNFGRRGTPPTHPELLDYLAHSLTENGWSTKQLIRQIVLSKAYQQASSEMRRAEFGMRNDDRPRPAAAALLGSWVSIPHSALRTPHSEDPLNLLVGRMNRKRLEVEPFRDALLAVGGNLDPAVGGRPADPMADPPSARRTLYLTIDRGNLPGLFRAFDFANPDLHSPGRHETTVPQQALFLLNSPVVLEQARKLSARVDGEKPADDPAWVRGLYRTAVGREATADEAALGAKFLAAAAALKTTGPQPPEAVWQYGHGRWDAGKQRVDGFTPLPRFQDDAWRAAEDAPPELADLSLSANGGHPGAGRGQVAARRWVAPADGVVSIEGMVFHTLGDDPPADADGILARVVTAGGVVAQIDLTHCGAEMNAAGIRVKAGDAIDFVVDPKADHRADSFEWRVSVTFAPTGRPQDERGYDSADDFRGPPPAAGPPLTPRQKLAQVLLMSNEFLYVD